MASTWIRTRTARDGSKRYRVEFRTGGRESRPRYAGSFRTRREALARKAWVTVELANMRVPDTRLVAEPQAATVRQVAARWQASRVDVSAGTAQTYKVALGRLLPRLGDRAVEQVDARASPISSPSCTKLASASRRSERPSRCWRWCSTMRASSPTRPATS
jgi:hypothetical protein